MIIKYGLRNNNIDVTMICVNRLCKDNMIRIPVGDDIRTIYFTDPLPNILKKIYVIRGDMVMEYDDVTEVVIDVRNDMWLDTNDNNVESIEASEGLKLVHNILQIKGGKMCGKNNIQIPHQNMLVQYLTGYEKVLEVGGNIGRSSIIIAYILNQKQNQQFVTLECNKNHIHYLHMNRGLNNLYFHIEESALSNKSLIQNNDGIILVGDLLISGYKNVSTITFTELEKKYNIIFDTLVLDCEYIFYYILIESPAILNEINMVIMTNDYNNINYKNVIDEHLNQNGFHLCCVENGNKRNFYEVWKKG